MTQIAKSIAVHALDQLSLGVEDLKARFLVLFKEAKLLDYVLNLCTKGTIEALTTRMNDSVELRASVIIRPVSQMF